MLWPAAGQDLNDDLATLEMEHGQDHILMEIEFPQVRWQDGPSGFGVEVRVRVVVPSMAAPEIALILAFGRRALT